MGRAPLLHSNALRPDVFATDLNVVLAAFRTTGALPIGTKLPVRKRDEPAYQPAEVLALRTRADGAQRTRRAPRPDVHPANGGGGRA
jgi:hypothetical protein